MSHLKEGAAVADVTLQSRTGGEVTRPKPDDLPRSSESELQRRLFDVGGEGKPHIYPYIDLYIYIIYIATTKKIEKFQHTYEKYCTQKKQRITVLSFWAVTLWKQKPENNEKRWDICSRDMGRIWRIR